jgi:hypothetical protein
MLTLKQKKKHNTTTTASGSVGAESPRKKTGKKHKSASNGNLECMVDCGHENHKPQQAPTELESQTLTPKPSIDKKLEDEKTLKRVLEAGLMINGLKQLLLSAAERIELHVNHNAITPALLTELDDVATAIGITTRKLNSIKAPCCDLYVGVIHDVGDEPDEESEDYKVDPPENLFDT